MFRALAPRRPWRDRRIVLGVTGGIAAYKAAQIARDLTQLGAEVDVVMTRSAHDFIGPITFEALTGRPVSQALIQPGLALEHIRLAREADLVCIAPATADLIARAATGRSDDLLTAILLATKAPVIVCPAMNDQMWAHPQTQANVRHLRELLGYTIVGPAVGPLAYGEGAGAGRLEEPTTIVEYVGRGLEIGRARVPAGGGAGAGGGVAEKGELAALAAGVLPPSAGAGPDSASAFLGKRIVVTAGPTREPVDPVRVLSNRSSGKMGFALAQAAWRRGAEVLLIAGPTLLEPPPGPELRRVETAAEMELAVREALPGAAALIMSAAVADFRPKAPATQKIKKAQAPSSIELEPAPDVLRATREARPPGLVTVGFALETGDAEAQARLKLESKDLDLIVLNEATKPGAGFEVDTNEVVILDRNGGAVELPLLPKDEVADAILDRLATLLADRR
jgi:phosphopantothenoylcysteine decarboxylase/phosphopantothenate--cysteine ligase